MPLHGVLRASLGEDGSYSSHIGYKSKRCVPAGSKPWEEAWNKGRWKMEKLSGDVSGKERRGCFRKLVKTPLVSSELFVVSLRLPGAKGFFFKVMEKLGNVRGSSYLKSVKQHT